MDYELYAKTFNPAVIEIPNIDTFKGTMPDDYELIEYQEGTDPEENGCVLYGFDEIYMFGFSKPKHCFVRQSIANPLIDAHENLHLEPGSLAWEISI